LVQIRAFITLDLQTKTVMTVLDPKTNFFNT